MRSIIIEKIASSDGAILYFIDIDFYYLAFGKKVVKKVRCLLDTGSSISLIDKDFFEKNFDSSSTFDSPQDGDTVVFANCEESLNKQVYFSLRSWLENFEIVDNFKFSIIKVPGIEALEKVGFGEVGVILGSDFIEKSIYSIIFSTNHTEARLL